MCASLSLDHSIALAALIVGANPTAASTGAGLAMRYDALPSRTASALAAGVVRAVAAGARRWLCPPPRSCFPAARRHGGWYLPAGLAVALPADLVGACSAAYVAASPVEPVWPGVAGLLLFSPRPGYAAPNSFSQAACCAFERDLPDSCSSSKKAATAVPACGSRGEWHSG